MAAPTRWKVWYRSRPMDLGEKTLKAMEDSGTLTVQRGFIKFEGSKGTTLEIRDIERVFSARAGRDFINRWTTIEYGPGRMAIPR